MSLDKVIKSLDSVEAKMNQFNQENEVISERLNVLEQRNASTDGFIRSDVAHKTLGSQVLEEVKNNAELLSKTDKLRLEIKAATDPITTTSARTLQSGGIGFPAGMSLGVQFAMPTRMIGATSAVEYSRYTGIEGGAAQQEDEGDAKSAVRPTFSLINQPAITIAGYSKISKQALNDSAALLRAIDGTLQRSLHKSLDTILNTGAWGGLLTLATAYTSLVYTNMADAASEGVAYMQEAGFNPDTVIMKPSDWLALTTEKATGSGEYLSGAYLAPLPEMLRGLRVVLSPTITAGKCMVVDSSQIELLIVENLTVEIGTDGNDFTTNVRTILGEMRVIPTFLSVGAARLITPKASA